MGMSKEQAGCPLCKAAVMEMPEAAFIGAGDVDNPVDFVILPTKTLKGHKYRYMILTTQHLGEKEVSNSAQAEAYLFYFMRGKVGDKDLEGFDLLQPTHATIPEHFHRVASSWDDGAEDASQIDDTDKVTVLFEKAWSKVKQDE